ncbi:MAG: magnesium transporter [Truepera sp.]|nr:magnesium transporter [Truepera sp.]
MHLATVSPEIASLIHEKRWGALARYRAWPETETLAPELADALLKLNPADRVLLFRALPKEIAAEVFSYLEGEPRDALLRQLTDHETLQLLDELSPDDRTALLGELPGRVTQRLLNLLSPEDLREARQLLGYPEQSVGRLMTPDYLAVRPEWTIDEALKHIRTFGHESETADIIYVTDARWRLLDDLPLQRLVMTVPDKRVHEIMDNTYVALRTSDNREEAVRMMQRYDRVALPVVDSDGVLVGIITVDDVLDVAEAEATEDFHKVAAIAPLRMSYWEASKTFLFRSRIGWLIGLVLVNLASSGIIAGFEELLTASIALAFFIPLIIDTGGNAGAQSATLMVRAIATGDVKLNQWARAFTKELVIGIGIGLTVGLAGLLLGFLRGGFEIGLVVMLTMVVMLVFTNLIGLSLPFILTRFGLDPALASGPVITSIADAVGLLIYFSIAAWILGLG